MNNQKKLTSKKSCVFASDRLPDHLPEKLTMSFWMHAWVTMAQPRATFCDLEKRFLELKERSFNAIRIDAGYNWAFDLEGNPRGKISFRPFVNGYGDNLCMLGGVGGRIDVLKRLEELFTLAKKHNVFICLTSWDYQETLSYIDDEQIRLELAAIHPQDRFRKLAENLDRTLTFLKGKGLHRQIAYAEIHNEPGYSEFPTYHAVHKALHEAELAVLRKRHPDILISADYNDGHQKMVPDNAQLYDKHLYMGSAFSFFLPNQLIDPPFNRDNPMSHPVLKDILRRDFTPWKDYMAAAQNVRWWFLNGDPAQWRAMMWLYDNIDNEKYDVWAARFFKEGDWNNIIHANVDRLFTTTAAEARERNLPLVLDEVGAFLYPPKNSLFEQSEPVRDIFEHIADAAIAHGYWTFMLDTYANPHCISWEKNPAWIKYLNEKFLNGK